MRKPELVPEWRRCFRMFSQWAFLAAGSLQTVWLTLDAEQRASLPDGWVSGITLAVVALGFVGRLVKQKGVSGE